MSVPGTVAWFARHEFRLAWRDWLSMMTAGRRTRVRTLAVVLAMLAVVMHLVAFAVVSRFAEMTADKTMLVMITGSLLMMWSLMLSHALEQVARAFYARADLDLLLSSPADTRTIFSIRLGAIAVSVITTAMLTAAPFINVLAATGGTRWLAAYAAVIAIGAAAAAAATILAALLFATVGPKRTRLIAQIAAAVIGAGFVIALQFAVIASTGTMSRLALLTSESVVAMAPDTGSFVWWPARAVLGDADALAIVLGASLVLLSAAIALVAPRFAGCVTAAAGVAHAAAQPSRREPDFRTTSPVAALRRKEWRLLLRDPWLVSQSLMQLLYLLPPAFLLWRSFGDKSGAEVLLVPVLVMAAGQLAGGLAWLAISAEHAPDLVMTAPLGPGQILRAKIDTVMGAIAIVFAPFVVALAVISPFCALVTAIGNALAATSATHIQLCFRAQAKRSHFRRRQTSSRVATFAEAFASIGWAAAAALAASGTSAAAVPAAMAVGVLAAARYISPHKLTG
jgi:ABC-2 type transport system permease protein